MVKYIVFPQLFGFDLFSHSYREAATSKPRNNLMHRNYRYIPLDNYITWQD